jgi:hypothetical protein
VVAIDHNPRGTSPALSIRSWAKEKRPIGPVWAGVGYHSEAFNLIGLSIYITENETPRNLRSPIHGNLLNEMLSWKCTFQSPQTSQFEASQFHSLLFHGHPHWLGSLKPLSPNLYALDKLCFEFIFIVFALVF